MARLRCKLWHCPHCSNVNRRYWRAIIYNHINAYPDKKWSFHTFTLDSKYHALGRLESIRFIKRNWQKLLQALIRLYGVFDYVRVVEFHSSGIPHIHLLASFEIPKSDLSRSKKKEKQYIKKLKHDYKIKLKNGKKRKYKAILLRLGYGYMTNSQNAHGNDKQITSYITKYMTKMDDDFSKYAKRERLRIVQTSRSIKAQKRAKNDDIWVSYEYLSLGDYAKYPVIIDLDRDKPTTRDDLDENWQYPHADEYKNAE